MISVDDGHRRLGVHGRRFGRGPGSRPPSTDRERRRRHVAFQSRHHDEMDHDQGTSPTPPTRFDSDFSRRAATGRRWNITVPLVGVIDRNRVPRVVIASMTMQAARYMQKHDGRPRTGASVTASWSKAILRPRVAAASPWRADWIGGPPRSASSSAARMRRWKPWFDTQPHRPIETGVGCSVQRLRHGAAPRTSRSRSSSSRTTALRVPHCGVRHDDGCNRMRAPTRDPRRPGPSGTASTSRAGPAPEVLPDASVRSSVVDDHDVGAARSRIDADHRGVDSSTRSRAADFRAFSSWRRVQSARNSSAAAAAVQRLRGERRSASLRRRRRR